MTEVVTTIREIIESYLGDEGLELDDLLVVPGPKSQVLRVIVDGPDGVSLNLISDLSRDLGHLMEGTPYDLEKYGLEVTSPGLERTLRTPLHWEKSLGRSVVVKTKAEVDGSRRHTGVLSAINAGTGVVTSDDGEHLIPFEEVLSAKTVFVWEKSPKPGKKGASK
jgi:ribosome maturation factor RimP